jgi:hypothetical protein
MSEMCQKATFGAHLRCSTPKAYAIPGRRTAGNHLDEHGKTVSAAGSSAALEKINAALG